MAVPQGIEGVDLLELKIISTDRLPPVAEDFDSAKRTVEAFGSGGDAFTRPGAVGRYPSGPSANYSKLANLLGQALGESSRNLHDTSDAIGHFLNLILEADGGARGRMNKAETELEGTGTGG